MLDEKSGPTLPAWRRHSRYLEPRISTRLMRNQSHVNMAKARFSDYKDTHTHDTSRGSRLLIKEKTCAVKFSSVQFSYNQPSVFTLWLLLI
jgi:hypothetical protein